MPDLRSMIVAAPLADVDSFVKSSDFKSTIKERVFGMVSVRITRSDPMGTGVWIGVTGEGSDVSVRIEPSGDDHSRITLWFGTKMIAVMGCLFLPFFGLGLIFAAIGYMKKKGKAKGLGERIASIFAEHFKILENAPIP